MPHILVADKIAEPGLERLRQAEQITFDVRHGLSPEELADAIGEYDGVLIRSLSSPFASDSMVVLRPRLSQEDLSQALVRGIKHEGKRYDFDFDFTRSDRIACTEVVYRAFEGVGSMRLQLTTPMGRLTLSGCDLIGMGLEQTFFEPLAVYAPHFAPGLVTGPEVGRVLALAQQRAKLSMAV